MSSGVLRLVIAGGGTGGHLYPGLAIADEVRRQRPGAQIAFIGTKGKIEERVVPRRGYVLHTIWISGLARRLSPATVLFPLQLAVSLVQSLVLLLRLRPAAVAGTGGYVCGPPLFAATLLGIPALIQEQNSYPGVTTRLLAGRVAEVHLTFDASRRYLRRLDNVKVTGNPVRETIGTIARRDGAALFGLDPSKRTVLVIGGSQGAASVNTAMLAAAPHLASMDVQVIWGTGERDYERVVQGLASAAGATAGAVRPFRYIEHMECAYAAADLAVARAGATTLSELMAAGLPALLVPYPYAAADHQTLNARTLVDAGAAVMVTDHELAESLRPVLDELLMDGARRAEMARRARALGHPEAARQLAAALLRLGKA